MMSQKHTGSCDITSHVLPAFAWTLMQLQSDGDAVVPMPPGRAGSASHTIVTLPAGMQTAPQEDKNMTKSMSDIAYRHYKNGKHDFISIERGKLGLAVNRKSSCSGAGAGMKGCSWCMAHTIPYHTPHISGPSHLLLLPT